MSVSNILMTESSIFCLTDTLVYQIEDDGRGHPVGLGPAKALTFTGGFALSARGSVLAARQVADAIAHAADLDDAEIALLDFLPVWEQFRATSFNGGYVEAFLMGWSARHGGPRVVLADLQKHAAKFTVATLAPGLRLAPGYPGAILPIPKPGTPPDKLAAGMVKIAQSQFSVREARFPEMCIGGVMHLTSIDRDGARQRVVGLYDNYDALVEVFGGDPSADGVAAFRAGAGRAVA